MPPLATARCGSLDVPLTVWTAADAADLIAGLLAELAPGGPVAAIDLPGWTAAPTLGWKTRLFARRHATALRQMHRLPASQQGMAAVQAVCETTLASALTARFASFREQAALVGASAWLLRCPGGLAAATTVLAPGGHLVLLSQSERDAVDIATLTDRDGGNDLGLSFAAYLVAATPAALDAAVEGITSPRRTPQSWSVGIWQRRAPIGGGADA